MSYYNNNNNRNNPNINNNLISWIIAIVCLFAFWPIGLFLIIKLITGSTSQSQRAKNEAHFTGSRAAYDGQSPFFSFESGAANKSTGKKTVSQKKKQASKKTPPATGAVPLLILAIVLFLIGFSNIFDFFDSGIVSDLLLGLYFAIGGGVSLFFRNRIKQKARRLSKYITVMGFDDAKSVDEIADATGYSDKLVRKDLNYLAERGYFGPDAYFDIGLDSIVISSEAAESERQKRYAEEKAQTAEKNESADPYTAVLNEFRRLKDSITDPEISAKVAQLEILTSKIFMAVENDPEKAPDIRKFMDYYLPSTNKLLKSYSTLEKQGISGKNISTAKQDIERILDSLIEGYERQLDRLFDSDALDISTDIDVLENMLKRDGLTDDGDVFRSAAH